MPYATTSDDDEKGSKSGGCFGCLARVPCASLIAWIMMVIGLGGFCAASYIGIVRTRDLLNATWFMECTEICLIIISSVTFPLATIFLVVAWLSSGSTPLLLLNSCRKNLAARIFNVLSLLLAYLLHIAWVGLFAIALVPFYMMVLIWYLKDVREMQCIDLDNYGLGLLGRSVTGKIINGSREFCRDSDTNDLEAFFERMCQSWICWLAATAGALLVILSLVHFMVAIGGNLKHLKGMKTGTCCKQSKDTDDNDSVQRYETKL